MLSRSSRPRPMSATTVPANFANTGVHPKIANTYAEPSKLYIEPMGVGRCLDYRGREGDSGQRARAGSVFHFHARDLHLVLGPTAEGKPVRFRVLLDGRPLETITVSTSTPRARDVSSQRLYHSSGRPGRSRIEPSPSSSWMPGYRLSHSLLAS